MPHISKQKLSKKNLELMSSRLSLFLTSTNNEIRSYIFKELITSTEQIMIAKRLAMIFLLDKGLNTYKISKILKVSQSTAARFEKSLENGRYKNTRKWLEKTYRKRDVLSVLVELASIPFNVRFKSLNKVLKEGGY